MTRSPGWPEANGRAGSRPAALDVHQAVARIDAQAEAPCASECADRSNFVPVEADFDPAAHAARLDAAVVGPAVYPPTVLPGPAQLEASFAVGSTRETTIGQTGHGLAPS